MRSEPAQKRSLALALAFLCATLVMPAAAAADEGRSAARAEYEVKAAFVYNFIKFVEWPVTGGTPPDRVRLCVLGTVPDALPFANLAGASAGGKKIAVLTVKDSGELRGCDVLFVAAGQTGRLGDVLGVLKDGPVLTIGDTEGYARRGVMINMFLENKRVRFEINEEKAKAAGLRISVKLLKLAGKVYGPSGKKEE